MTAVFPDCCRVLHQVVDRQGPSGGRGRVSAGVCPGAAHRHHQLPRDPARPARHPPQLPHRRGSRLSCEHQNASVPPLAFLFGKSGGSFSSGTDRSC